MHGNKEAFAASLFYLRHEFAASAAFFGMPETHIDSFAARGYNVCVQNCPSFQAAEKILVLRALCARAH